MCSISWYFTCLIKRQVANDNWKLEPNPIDKCIFNIIITRRVETNSWSGG
ncbi:hypothetical protein Fmac_009983 [Flemingia macrophylla]|uniref:Uncharacterized protein n=1 Tax=Flemingia macrophylla TaxID=520843 RepID=A0ABD1N1R4_9FABA